MRKKTAQSKTSERSAGALFSSPCALTFYKQINKYFPEKRHRWPLPGKAAGKMGRVAVLKPYRGKGIGRVLIDVLEEHLRERRGKAGEALKGKQEVESIAHSQAYAQGFYEKVSFTLYLAYIGGEARSTDWARLFFRADMYGKGISSSR